MSNGNMPANVVTEEQWDRSESAAPATGLTKREHFAGLAMQGLTCDYRHIGNWEQMAQYSVEMADALLAELDKGNNNDR